jgi:hypothetical protein
MRDGALRRGDLVEVRSAAEILETLDEHGELDAMPFMPEMVPYCGRRFTVDRRADKICDTISSSLRSRRMDNTVLLDDLRCDGSAHGGCQAECRYYWNEAWLRRVQPGAPPPGAANDDDAVAALLARVQPATQWTDDAGEVRFRCQATQTNAASIPLSTADLRSYVGEVSSKNVSVRKFARVMLRAVIWQPMHHFRILRWPKGTSEKSPPKPEPLGLQSNEWVRVKSLEEIEATLTTGGTNRGLHFDPEMVPYCGTVLKVRGRVTRIIDEPTGKMLEFGSDCIKLDNAVCSGERSTGRWFCPREIYPYWRESWLERVDESEGVPG